MESQFITKYRPYFLDDFYFDQEVKDMIRILLTIEDLNVLFLGNSNSGKTSLLYAIIREYYGLGKNARFPENNILFINNLKEQGINYFRNEMKSFCQSRSSIHGKKKMIIIDDIDMINQQNQQVFCNYIDKYKDNVCFVSCCSNIQKIIENIQSRTHILKIRSPTLADISELMGKIVAEENMVLSPESTDYILSISNYSIRSMINYLEKINIYCGGDLVDVELAKQICSNISFQLFHEYIVLVKQGLLSEAIKILYDIHDYGYSVIDILDYFFFFIKLTDLLTEDEKYETIKIICKYITIFHITHEDIIELALFTGNLLPILV